MYIEYMLVFGFASSFLISRYLAWKLTGVPKESVERSSSNANIDGTPTKHVRKYLPKMRAHNSPCIIHSTYYIVHNA